MRLRKSVVRAAVVVVLTLVVASPAAVAAPRGPSLPGDQLWAQQASGQSQSLAVSPDGATVFVHRVLGASWPPTGYATTAYDAATGGRLWEKRETGGSGELAVSPDGATVYVGGASYGEGTVGEYDGVTIAYDALTGARLWSARYNGPASSLDQLSYLAVSPDGSTVYTAGESWKVDGDAESSDYLILARNAQTGRRLWVKRYDGPGRGYDIVGRGNDLLELSPDGATVYVTGTSTGLTSGLDYATLALDAATGSRRWVKRYDGPAHGDDNVSSLAMNPDGSSLYVTGSDIGVGTGMDYATVAYDAATGARQWSRRYNGPGNGDDWAGQVGVTPDGSTVVVAGHSPGVGTGIDAATVAYAAANGAPQWTSRYDGPLGGDEWVADLAVAPDGSSVFVTGSSWGGTSEVIVTIAYGMAAGSEQWATRNDVTPALDAGWRVVVAPDGATLFVATSLNLWNPDPFAGAIAYAT